MAMSRPFVLRPIQEGDVPAILLLARTLDKWFNPEGLRKMAHDLAVQGGFVAVRAERILGFVTWEPLDERLAELTWMGVAEAEQRAGLGRALLAALVEELRRLRFRELEASTVADSVDYEPYADTRRFYRAMGFVDHHVDPQFWGEGEDKYDRLVLRRSL